VRGEMRERGWSETGREDRGWMGEWGEGERREVAGRVATSRARFAARERTPILIAQSARASEDLKCTDDFHFAKQCIRATNR